MITLIAVIVAAAFFVPQADSGQAESEFELQLRIADDQLVVAVGAVDAPLAILQGVVYFDASEFGLATCESMSVLGACNDNDGRVDFASVAPEGITSTTDLFTIVFDDGPAGDVADYELELTYAETVDRQVATARTGIVREVNSSSRWPMAAVWIAVGLAVAATAVLFVRSRRDQATPDLD